MKTLATTAIALAISLLAAAPLHASQGDGYRIKHDNIHERLEHQQYRIKSGVRNQQLTHKEAKTLKQHQRDIRYLLRLFSEDGRLSKKERRILNRELGQSSRQIKRLKHNDLDRYVKLHQRHERSQHDQRL